MIPYSGKLSGEKTFAIFKVCRYLRKFSLQNWEGSGGGGGGGGYLLAVTSASNLQKFFPRKFSSLEVSRYAVLNCVWVHYTQNSKKMVSFPNPQYGTRTREITGQ